ncbi:TPA: hypothetical protein DDW35_05380 [Candidatus Sumerlaeota bacterium]|nr:hypothetical protein [Candidatus Sumerlaeota bacterium]
MHIISSLISLGIGWIINSFILWIVLNWLYPVEDGAKFGKCILAALLMALGGVLAALCLLIPIIGIVLFLIAWYKLSVIVLESIFEMTTGAGAAFLIYLLVNIVIKMVVVPLFL